MQIFLSEDQIEKLIAYSEAIASQDADKIWEAEVALGEAFLALADNLKNMQQPIKTNFYANGQKLEVR